MIVVDAGIVAAMLVDDSDTGSVVRDVVRGQSLYAPELVDLEVTSVLRKLVRRGTVPKVRARQALGDLIELPIERARHTMLLDRCWSLRDNFTAYDASYVALAEILQVPLLTGDARLAAAPGSRCRIDVIRG